MTRPFVAGWMTREGVAWAVLSVAETFVVEVTHTDGRKGLLALNWRDPCISRWFLFVVHIAMVEFWAILAISGPAMADG